MPQTSSHAQSSVVQNSDGGATQMPSLENEASPPHSAEGGTNSFLVCPSCSKLPPCSCLGSWTEIPSFDVPVDQVGDTIATRSGPWDLDLVWREYVLEEEDAAPQNP